MADDALHKHWTRCSLIFDNTSVSESLVPPLTKAFTGHGGAVVANVTISPDQTSYRSEVLKAFAGKPQCVFTQVDDPQTAGTLFANIREVGDLNVPFVGTNKFIEPDIVKAVGATDMHKWVTGANSASPSGAAFTHFSELFKAKYHQAPNTYNAEEYDAVIIAALAMTAAHSTNGQVWARKVLSVANPPGVRVTTWAAGKAAAAQNKEINYVGASGSTNFDPVHHRASTGWAMEQVDATGANPAPVFVITAQQLLGY